MKLIPILFLINSFSALAIPNKVSDERTNNQDLTCVSITQDLATIKEYQESGKYRALKNSNSKPSFSFQDDQSFAQYLDYARDKIRTENPKAAMPCPLETQVSKKLYPNLSKSELTTADLVAPYELQSKESRKGILLVHGLTDSPFLFHDLSAEFNKMGITVRTLLIPGHATAPEALIDISEENWRKAAHFAVNRMLKDFDTVLLGGFSTGGALMLDQIVNVQRSQTQLEKIKGVLLWAPAIQAKSKLAWAAKYVDAIPFVDYETKSSDIDFAKYESFPFNAAAQVNELMNSVYEASIPTHNIPLLVVASEVDQTIDSSKTIEFVNRWNEARVDKSLTSNESKPQTIADVVVYFGKDHSQLALNSDIKLYLPTCHKNHTCQKVIDISHNAAPISPSNQFYGFNGIYKNCEHLINTDYFSSCKSAINGPLGEISIENLAKYPTLARLTFNPYFEETLSEIKLFVDRTKR